MRALLLCILLSACAATTAPTRDGGHLLAGAAIGAPEGLVAFCERRPAECGPDIDVLLRGRISSTGAASWQTASLRPSMTGQSAFQAMMAARASRVSDAAAPVGARMTLSDARWQELDRVNRNINRVLRPATDRVQHGVEEYWDRPLASFGAGARGDCEDYALEKRAELLALGWAPDMLAIAVAVAPGVGLHAVLVAQTHRGDFVLDNLYDQPRAIGELRYMWVSRQSGESLTRWASAYVAMPERGQHMEQHANGAALFQQMMLDRVAASAPRQPEETPETPVQDMAIMVRAVDAAPLPEVSGLDLNPVTLAEKLRLRGAPAKDDKSETLPPSTPAPVAREALV